MEEKLDEIKANIGEVKSLLENSIGKINDRDSTIKEKDARITELTDKLVKVSKEKDDALWEKIDLMKAITNEREEMHDQFTNLRREILLKEEKIKNLKKKSREAQDGLMGSSFEVDRMKKEVERRDQEIKDFEEKVASVSTGSTGIIYDVNSAMEYMLGRIAIANRSLRFVAPSIEFMEQNGIIDAIEQLPESSVVNIATSMSIDEHSELIDKWKSRGWYVNNYQGENFLMISANGSDVAIAYYSQGRVSGFYSNIEDLVSIFKQALMYPFIKGQKL